jgi:hypothetical protein
MFNPHHQSNKKDQSIFLERKTFQMSEKLNKNRSKPSSAQNKQEVESLIEKAKTQKFTKSQISTKNRKIPHLAEKQ